MMRSESTRALGQPRLTKPIFGAGGRGGSDVIAALIRERAAAVDWRRGGSYSFGRLPIGMPKTFSLETSMVRMTTRLERPQGLGSVLAVLAILLSLPGHASAQQAGGQAPAGGTVPKQAAPKAAANGQEGAMRPSRLP